MDTLAFKLYMGWALLFGACIGSFVNVVVYRLPKGKFFSGRRSYCPECGKHLAWNDLIPVISYLTRKGRCLYCGARISPRYPVVEAVCAAFAMLSFARFGLNLQAGLAFGFLAVLLSVSLIDFDTREIPDSLIVALIPFAVCAVWAWKDVSIIERAAGFFAVSLPMLVLAVIIDGAFGGGDIKLIAVCGFLLGWKNALLAFSIALLAGGVYASYLLISGKSKRGESIAFGPYLCVGAAVALFWGTEIIRVYLNIFP